MIAFPFYTIRLLEEEERDHVKIYVLANTNWESKPGWQLDKCVIGHAYYVCPSCVLQVCMLFFLQTAYSVPLPTRKVCIIFNGIICPASSKYLLFFFYSPWSARRPEGVIIVCNTIRVQIKFETV